MKIYFLHNGLQSFVRKDLDILRSTHQVRVDLNFRRKAQNLVRNIVNTWWCDVLFCWFASPHLLIPLLAANLFGRKIIVVAGGYDVASVPEIGYGAMQGGIRAAVGRFILRSAHLIITVSNANLQDARANGRVAEGKLRKIYHGFPAVEPAPVPKTELVITVGEVTWKNLERKGLHQFSQSAHHFRPIPFKLVGRWVDDSGSHLQKRAPSNLELTGFVNDETLKDLFCRAKVYVQASAHEAFGCSVAEAMLHRCIPVVSDRYALPEVVEDAGFIFRWGDLEDLKAKIKLALSANDELGDRARQRILETFPLDARKKALLHVLESVGHERIQKEG